MQRITCPCFHGGFKLLWSFSFCVKSWLARGFARRFGMLEVTFTFKTQINFSSTADSVSLYSSITGLSFHCNEIMVGEKVFWDFSVHRIKRACRTEHRIIFKIILFCVFVFLWGIYNFTSCIWNDHIMPAFPSPTCANRNILSCSSEGCGSSML